MWNTIKEALTIPIIVVITGKYMGFDVSRNPLDWFSLFIFGLILIPFTIFIYPIAICLMWLGFALTAFFGYNTKISSEGIEIFSSAKGKIQFCKWDEIEYMDYQFEAPVFFPVLHLLNGVNIKLKTADSKILFAECKKYGIPVYGSTKDDI